MKSKVFYIVLLLSSAFLSVFSSYRLNLMYKKYLELEQVSILKTDSLRKITSIIENVNSIKEQKAQNCILKNIVNDKSTELFSIFGKFPNGNIVFRLMNTSCGSCIDKQIEIISKLAKLDNLIVLSNSNNARLIRLFIDTNNIISPVYQLDSSQCLFHNDDCTRALLMYVDSKGTILRAYYLNEDTLWLMKYIVPLKII